MGRRRHLVLAAVILAGLTGPAGLRAGNAATTLSDTDHAFLVESSSLLTADERAVFLGLEKAYRRTDFIDRFWDSRDPFPETRANELVEIWQRRRQLAMGRYDSLAGDRARTMILLGPPREIVVGLCTGELRPIEVWRYEATLDPSALGLPGSSLAGADLPADFRLVFVESAAVDDGFVHWRPETGLESLLLDREEDSTPARPPRSRRELARRCLARSRAVDMLTRAVDWETLVLEANLIPAADTTWLDRFTDLDLAAEGSTDGEDLPVSLSIALLGGHGARTVLQGVLSIPRTAVQKPSNDGGGATFGVSGELVQGDRLVDAFRYAFELDPEHARGDEMSMVFERHLPRGDYSLTLGVVDEGSGRRRRITQEIHVPAPSAAAVEIEAGPDLAEANTPPAPGDCVVTILPPPRTLHTGRLRIEARVQGEGVQSVAFILDGRPVMSKTRPPYSLELDLGRAPRIHTLVAVARAADGTELARDNLPINAGPHRFAVRLVEPRPHQRYRHSLRARVELDLPRSERLERIDLFVNESRQVSLFEPPWTQPIILSEHESVTYVRAVAYLADGNSSEDLVFVNLEGDMDSLRINFVELFTTVVDKAGRPVEGLGHADFSVSEEGIEQRVARFESVRDLPIHAGIMLDTSTSMTDELPDAVLAGLRFFDSVLRPRDRASVVAFSDAPTLEVPFTNRIDVLSNGVRHLEAGGETTLYDSLVFTLHYFAGIRGKRAIILLSDGSDSGSAFTFEETLDFARRTGVTIYTIGMGVSARDLEARAVLRRLARETGGRYFAIDGTSQLDSVYSRIEEELRAQYLLGYQSSIVGGDTFREVRVELSRKGLEARTIPGYYP